jgi:transcriptional regulator with XRE-family HTH domain
MSERIDTIEDWIDLFVDYLAGGTQNAPRLDQLPPELRDDARHQAEVVAELWGRRAQPDGAMGDVARSLGFQHLDSTVTIAGSAMRRARKDAGLTVSDLARELTDLGWQVTGAQLGEIETGKRVETPGIAVPLIAARLNLDAGALIEAGESIVDRILKVQGAREAISAAAARLGRTVEDLTAALRPQLAAAQFRERESGETDLVEIVEALLSDLEDR